MLFKCAHGGEQNSFSLVSIACISFGLVSAIGMDHIFAQLSAVNSSLCVCSK